MTVMRVGVGVTGDEVYCVWFDGMKKYAGVPFRYTCV